MICKKKKKSKPADKLVPAQVWIYAKNLFKSVYQNEQDEQDGRNLVYIWACIWSVWPVGPGPSPFYTSRWRFNSDAFL